VCLSNDCMSKSPEKRTPSETKDDDKIKENIEETDAFGRIVSKGSQTRSKTPDSDADFRRKGSHQSNSASVGRTRKRNRSRSWSRSPSPRRSRSRTPSTDKRRRPNPGRRERGRPTGGPLPRRPERPLPRRPERREVFKKDTKEKHSQLFFDQHKDEDWFREKYDFSRIAERKAQIRQYYLKAYQWFQEDTAKGELRYLEMDVKSDAEPVLDHTKNEDSDDMIVEKKEEEIKKLKTEENSDESKPEARFVDNTIRVVSISPQCSRAELEKHFGQVEGFRGIVMAEPDSSQNFCRSGWIFYQSKQLCEEAYTKLNNSKIDNCVLRLRPNRKTISLKPPAPSGTLELGRIEHDLDRAIQLVKQLDKDHKIENFLFSDPGLLDSLQPTLKRLNLLLAFLRRVHCYCYYCHTEFPSPDKLFEVCGEAHLRSNVTTKESMTKEFFGALDETVAQRLLSSPTVTEDESLRAVNSAQSLFITENIKKKGKSRFKCVLCTKLFKGYEFVQKHMALKHAPEVEEGRRKALSQQFLQNYLDDPNAPSDIPSTTHAVRQTSPSRSRSRKGHAKSRSRSVSPSKSRNGSRRYRGGRSRDFDRYRKNNGYARFPQTPLLMIPVIPANGGPPVYSGFSGRNSGPRRPKRDFEKYSSRNDRSIGERVDKHEKPERIDNNRRISSSSVVGTPSGRPLIAYDDLDAPPEEEIVVDYGNFALSVKS